MDDVELDLRNMGAKRWRTRVLNRTERACVVRAATAKLKGCSANEEEEGEKLDVWSLWFCLEAVSTTRLAKEALVPCVCLIDKIIGS
jgi:hypothetical protein